MSTTRPHDGSTVLDAALAGIERASVDRRLRQVANSIDQEARSWQIEADRLPEGSARAAWDNRADELRRGAAQTRLARTLFLEGVYARDLAEAWADRALHFATVAWTDREAQS